MKKTIMLIFGLAFLLAACSSSSSGITGNVASDVGANGASVTVFKSPSCGCCGGYVSELKSKGFDVDVKQTGNVDAIKKQYGVPSNMLSCHTTIVGDYFVEGHVPVVAVNKLIQEKPDIDGIALPGMPAGSPGMGGAKSGTWTIYAVKDGKTSEFMQV